MSSSDIDATGLNLASDGVTPEELAAFRKFYADIKGGPNKSHEFWLEFRPELVKLTRARTKLYRVGHIGVVAPLMALHRYVIEAFHDGILYEATMAQSFGASKSDILDTVSIAFIHSGHPGMYAASSLAPFLRTFEQDKVADFPSNWSFDPDAFKSGMDFSTIEASEKDLTRLREWYEETLGEIPPYVHVFAKHRPDLLKAYRNRYENAIRESLPKQMLPYFMLHHNVLRGFGDGIRENVLLARAVGLTRSQVTNSVFSAVQRGGANVLDLVEKNAGDLFETFPDD